MRKRNANSKLFSLPEATQRAIFEECEPMTLDDGVKWLSIPEREEGWGIDVSTTVLSEFLQYHRAALWRQQLRAAAQTADDVVDDELRARGEVMDEAILFGVRTWIQDSLSKGAMSPKDAKSLVGLILKGRDQAIDKRKLDMLEKKAAAMDAVEEAGKEPGGISRETLDRIRKEAGLG